MNNEERPSYMGLIFKILLVIIAVLALMWFFPMPNMKPVYDRLFVDNINSMKDAAKSYYTVERLPKDINGKATMNLQEMIDKKLVLPIIDSQGKACNTSASYVEVTRVETEFLLKVNLSCPTRTDYIIEHLGCYNLCSNPCDKSEKEYQFSRNLFKGCKTVNGQGKEYEFIKYADKFDHYEYSCSQGSKDPKDETICNVTNTVDANKSCESGYNLVGNTCVKTSDPNKVCPNGFTLSGNTCVKPANSTEVITGYTCPAGYTKSGNPLGSTCTKDATRYGDTWISDGITTSHTALSVYQTESKKRVYIGSYDVLECDACVPTTVYKYHVYHKELIHYTLTDTGTPVKTTQYNCPTGSTLSGTQCTTNYNLVCSEGTGTLNGNICTLTGNIVYSCPTGIPVPNDKTKCTKNTIINADKKGIYIKVVSDKQWSTSTTLEGYTATGNSRVISSFNKQVCVGWVTVLPSGYTKTDQKIEYQWSKSATLAGWTSTGQTR